MGNKILFLATIFLLTGTVAGKTNDEMIFRQLQRNSEDAFALATAHQGNFKDARLNALTDRIRTDQRVIQKTLKDTARVKDISLPVRTLPIPSPADTDVEYLQREISLHESILHSIGKSSSPVLKNMAPRIQAILSNAHSIARERKQAQEENPGRKP